MESQIFPETKILRPPLLLERCIDWFRCPDCGQGDLRITDSKDQMHCLSCARAFSFDNGIPQLFYPHTGPGFASDGITQTVKAFYEQNPFPNYEQIESVESLRQKAERGVFSRLLDEQIPYDAKILEVGCGTGQLSNFLGLSGTRFVFGADMCCNSLELGNAFKERNRIQNVAFVQMNLFRPVFKPETFDVVICNGVLHHTADPLGGFQSIQRLVKKGGYILIGLYNRYGRISNDLRRVVFNCFGDRFQFLDPRLRKERLGERRKQSWFMDQYKHPHESKHTMGELLRWFDQAGFQFISGIPKSTAFESFSDQEEIFKAQVRGSWVDRLIVQSSMFLTGGREGGFFLMVGRKDISEAFPR